MADTHFTAGGRIPTRPLSYESVSLAENKELIADYTNAKLYIKDVNGALKDITASVSEMVQEVVNEIKNNPEDLKDAIKVIVQELIESDQDIEYVISCITISLDGGKTQTTLIDLLTKHENEINKLKELFKTDGSGNTSIDITKIIINENGDTFEDRIPIWDAKTRITEYKQNITASSWSEVTEGDNTYYKARVACAQSKATDNPIVDVDLSSASTYEAQIKLLEDYSNIYRIQTEDGYITAFATGKPDSTITIIMKLERA